MMKFTQYFSTRKTPQSEKIPGTQQVKMCSGGYGWEVDDWIKLDRFLVLGTEGGTYYVSERKLTLQTAEAVLRCIKSDGLRTVDRIVEISDAGRAPKNDPALFALAMAAKLGDEQTRAAAYKALPKVARIGTHIFHFAEFVKAFGGLGGNGFKRAISRWYSLQPARQLALQAVKYQQRDGWSHRDLLRLAHPLAPSDDHQAIFSWMVKGWQGELPMVADVAVNSKIIWAFEKAKSVTKVGNMVKLITDYRLPHEAVPNTFKQHPEVWEALLSSMPPGAMLRNLNKMTAVGLLTNTSEATKQVRKVLGSLEMLKRARVHPMAVLIALKTYQRGRGVKGQMTWTPVSSVVDALDQAFYLAFGAVEPSGKRLCLALDVSGSMTCGVSGAPFLSCREAAAAMALVTMNVEPMYEILGYTCKGRKALKGGSDQWWNHGVSMLSISPRQRLDDVVAYTGGLDFGGTDCALPILWALKHKVKVDAFVSYTDSESWAGEVHVDQALDEYRQKMGLPAKLVVVAMAANQFSVANPQDANQMDVVGFDAAAPNVINDFFAST